MATCNSSELLATGKCYADLTTKEIEIVTLSLLCKILQAYDPMASCTVATLLESGKCFQCLVPAQLKLIHLQLLCEIYSAVVGGGSGSIVALAGSATPVADPGVPGAIAYNQNGEYWSWDDATSQWVPFLT